MESNVSTKNHVEKSGVNKRFVIGVTSASLVAILAIGGSIAYLTDTDTIQNQFTLDTNLSIALEEANFDPQSAKDLLPTQEVVKDPKVANDGTVDAYVTATVKIPVMSGKILDDQNKIQTVADQDLYSYELKEGWSQYGDAVVKDGFREYTYTYSEILSGGEKTGSIFDSVKVVNFTEDPNLENVDIDITAYAIQSHGFDSAANAYEAFKTQSAAAVIAG